VMRARRSGACLVLLALPMANMVWRFAALIPCEDLREISE